MEQRLRRAGAAAGGPHRSRMSFWEIIDENVAVERWEEDDDDVNLPTSSEDELNDPADEGW